MLAIKPFVEEDRETYLCFGRDFYSGGAALHSIPEQYMEHTFDCLISGMPYADGFMLWDGDQRAGYCLISFLWSTEAGGLLALIDELYISPDFRGKKLGSTFLEEIEAYYQGKIVGLRLEVCDTNEGAIRLYQRHNFRFLDYRQMLKLFDKD